MAYEQLKEATYRANMRLVEAGLVILTWGNASEVDRAAGVMAIKPIGVDYSSLRPADMVVLSLKTGEVLAGGGAGCPSSDTPTHLHLYRTFPTLGGVVHTHSTYATSFAQAHREIPCFGTTHADYFHGPVPVTRPLTDQEISGDYELNTGKVIVECLQSRAIHQPLHVPGILVASHGPFTWGADSAKAVENALFLESVAQMALHSLALAPQLSSVPPALLEKHFLRKHGPGAYYGQKK